MIKRRELLGWLVIMRHQLDEDGEGDFIFPDEVKRALEDVGWIAHDVAAERLEITDVGRAEADLASPEWGVDSINVETT